MAKTSAPCSFPDCDRPPVIKGLCRAHRWQQRQGRKLTPIKPRVRGICSFPDCGRPHQANGLCQSHWHQQHRGSELKPLGPPGGNKPHMIVDVESRTKQCGGCGEMKSFEDFTKSASGKHGIGARCKTCRSEYMRKYGPTYYYRLPREKRDEMLIAQSGRCACCNDPLTDKYHVDHDHGCCPSYKAGRTCGECVRGLLCGPCNRGLGTFKDDVERLQKAIDYLLAYKKI